MTQLIFAFISFFFFQNHVRSLSVNRGMPSEIEC